jgi:hypothetical protein
MYTILPAIVGVLALTVGDVEPPGSGSTRTPTPAPAACTAPAYRQFDFWLGDWNVTRPDGRTAGSSRITRILGGCAIREEWTGASGSSGTSLNVYDADADRWRQTWVDDRGGVLLLTGGIRDGKMVLEGQTPAPGGKSVRQRITWAPASGGRVRQYWDSSSDGGKTWKTEFDGIYVSTR